MQERRRERLSPEAPKGETRWLKRVQSREELADRLNAQHQAVMAAIEQLNQALEFRFPYAGRPLPLAFSPANPADAAGSALRLEGARAPRVAVYCLGSFQLVVDGQPIESWPPGRARALFQYLVNRRNRLVTREKLIEALWPNPEAVAANTSLKVAVHALRQLLSRIKGHTTTLDAVARGAGYQLTAAELWLDVEEFEHVYARGRRHAAEGRVAEATADYARAAALYRGDFLEESAEEWVILRREGLKDQYLMALAYLADTALEKGDYSTCIERCQQLLEHDRCREDAYRTLMLCHAQMGQRGRVQRWYEVCVNTLRAELDVAPEPETEALFRAAIAGQFSQPSLRLAWPRQTAG